MIKPVYTRLLAAILFALIVFTQGAHAQEFGGNPPAIKWQQINTPAARVIFPRGLDSAGLRVAEIIQRMNKAIQPTIGFKQRQVSIVLQNQTTIANGYVGLAPFRSEFYLTPDQNSFELGSLYFPDQLAIHEFRHVQQYNNFNVGLSKGLRFLFGEGGQAFGNELSIPNWFFEGDAVFNETHVSGQGRGRIPFFFDGYRALWAAGKNYSYMKLRNGSYRDFTPDWYPLGYMMVSYGREKYGSFFWKDVTHDAAAFNGLFYPFQKAVKKHAGIDFSQFRANALNSFKQQFNDPASPRPGKNQHFVANQEYPAYVNDSTLVYMKSTYNHRPVFVLKTGTVEKDIRVRDLSIDNYFAYGNGRIVYAAYRPDVRWGYRNYSELRIVDIYTGAQQVITHGSKYFSPDFSADCKTIVAVQVDASGKSELHLLDADNGKLLAKVPNPDRLFFTYPKFYHQDKLIAAVRRPDGKMNMALIDIKTGKADYLLQPGYQPVGFPVVQGDQVYFTATQGKNERLFSLSPVDGKVYQLQNEALDASIGNYEPTVSANKLAWAGFTAYGYQLHQLDKNLIKWAPVPTKSFEPLPDLGISVLKKDSTANLLADVNGQPLPITKYNKSFHLFNFHSLIPNFSDPNYSLSLVGENVLNTFQSALLFNYNSNEGYKELGFNAVYGALFPYLSGGANYTLDRRGYSSSLGSNVYWNETQVHIGAQVPLNFTEGSHITGLSFGADAVYNSTVFQQPFRSRYADRDYTYLNNYISFSNQITKPIQNIYPRLAQSLSLNYKYAVNGLDANQFLATGSFYFPGLLTNHNLVITGAFQQKNRNSVVSFSNNFPFSRGYTAENLYQLSKAGVNYHFPIVYPDKGVANTIYFLRIRCNIFYDYTHANDFYTNGNPFKADFRTVGTEVFFDTQWFNQVPITFGIRYSHLQDPDLFGLTGRNRIELVVPLSFY